MEQSSMIWINPPFCNLSEGKPNTVKAAKTFVRDLASELSTAPDC